MVVVGDIGVTRDPLDGDGGGIVEAIDRSSDCPAYSLVSDRDAFVGSNIDGILGVGVEVDKASGEGGNLAFYFYKLDYHPYAPKLRTVIRIAVAQSGIGLPGDTLSPCSGREDNDSPGSRGARVTVGGTVGPSDDGVGGEGGQMALDAPGAAFFLLLQPVAGGAQRSAAGGVDQPAVKAHRPVPGREENSCPGLDGVTHYYSAADRDGGGLGAVLELFGYSYPGSPVEADDGEGGLSVGGGEEEEGGGEVVGGSDGLRVEWVVDVSGEESPTFYGCSTFTTQDVTTILSLPLPQRKQGGEGRATPVMALVRSPVATALK